MGGPPSGGQPKITWRLGRADARSASQALPRMVKASMILPSPMKSGWAGLVGSSGVNLNPDKLSCKLDDLYVFRNGAPTRFDPKEATRIVSQREHTITIDLGVGRLCDFYYGCDLSAEYVRINADYHT